MPEARRSDREGYIEECVCVHFSIRVVPQGEVFRQSSAVYREALFLPIFRRRSFASPRPCQWKTEEEYRKRKIVDGFIFSLRFWRVPKKVLFPSIKGSLWQSSPHNNPRNGRKLGRKLPYFGREKSTDHRRERDFISRSTWPNESSREQAEVLARVALIMSQTDWTYWRFFFLVTLIFFRSDYGSLRRVCHPCGSTHTYARI